MNWLQDGLNSLKKLIDAPNESLFKTIKGEMLGLMRQIEAMMQQLSLIAIDLKKKNNKQLVGSHYNEDLLHNDQMIPYSCKIHPSIIILDFSTFRG